MSTKKFMTATGSNRELHIKRSNEDHVQIRQFDPEFHTHQAKTFFLNPSEAPALCLAILEAAGAHKDSQDFLGGAVEQLKFHIGEQERITAEAKEQAELEAEALELYNAFSPDRKLSRISEAGYPERWLAVARRARALAKEATK